MARSFMVERCELVDARDAGFCLVKRKDITVLKVGCIFNLFFKQFVFWQKEKCTTDYRFHGSRCASGSDLVIKGWLFLKFLTWRLRKRLKLARPTTVWPGACHWSSRCLKQAWSTFFDPCLICLAVKRGKLLINQLRMCCHYTRLIFEWRRVATPQFILWATVLKIAGRMAVR